MKFNPFSSKKKATESAEKQAPEFTKNSFQGASKDKNTIKIGKTTWAINLRWIAKKNNIKNEAELRSWIRETAKKEKMDFAVNSKGQTIGFSSKGKGHKKKMPSLAASIAMTYSGNFIAAIRTKHGYYIVASKSGSVDPGSDVLMPPESTTQEIFQRIYKMAEKFDSAVATKVYAPADLGIEGAEEWERPIEKMKPNYKLQDVDPSAQFRIFITRVVLFSVFAGVMYYAYNLYEQLTAPPPPPKEITLPAKPWANKEKASEAIIECVKAIEKSVGGGPGWNAKTTVCKDGNISTAFTRADKLEEGGIPYSWFLEGIQGREYPIKGASVAPNGIVTYQMPTLETKTVWTENIVPEKMEDATKKIKDNLDSIFYSSNVSEKKERYYKTGSVTVTTLKNPEIIADVMGDVTGLVLDKITYDHDSGKYSIIVTITNEHNTPNAGKIVYQKPKPVRKFDKDYAKVYEK